MNIVITGTRKGIGRYLSEYYLKKGFNVIGCSRENSDLKHDNYIHYLVDVSEEEQINSFAIKVRKNFSHIDVLINNAGSALMNHFLMTPSDTARRLMNLNYMGAYNCSRAFINLLRKSEHPRIINFTSIAVPLNLDGELAYVVSKSAVEAFSKVLAKEVAQFKITVNAVGPTPIQTDLIAKVPKEKINKLLERQTIKRFGEYDDVANVVDFFTSEKSDFITGQVVYLGGITR
jgi:3-oxoacyl-[acyl-carrier protein] reductase